MCTAFAVRERLGDPRAVPGFRCAFLPDMPSSMTPESSDIHKFQSRDVDRLYLTVEDAALESGGKDVAEHEQAIFLCARRDVEKASIGKGNADKFGLGPIYLVPENPAAVEAMRVHFAAAILT